MDKEGFKKGRLRYIDDIAYKLKKSHGTSIPTHAEEKSFEEVLKHVIRVASSNGRAPTEGTFSCDSSSCDRKRDGKQCLKKIFDQLCWMERKRLYGPPTDNEIGYYLLIKKYIRSIVAFNLAAARKAYCQPFGCRSLYFTLHQAEDLMQINQHLADLSEFLLQINIADRFTLAPLMGIKDSNNAVPQICGSKERSYMFYSHKFLLASEDLKYSEFAHCTPSEDEERSYVHVLDDIHIPLSIRAEGERNACSEEYWFNLYLERTHQDIVDIERHFEKVKKWILNNLSLMDWWESLTEDTKAFEYEEYENHELAEFRKKLTDKCEVSIQDLPQYISKTDRYLTIAQLFMAFVMSCSRNISRANLFKVVQFRKQTEWEAHYALTLFKHVHLENHQLVDQDENVVILKEMIEDLRCIGDSDIVLDQADMALARKIWGRVASSTHFFLSAITYEQRQCTSQDFTVPELTRKTVDAMTVDNKQYSLEEAILEFARTLEAYKVGLQEKLRNSVIYHSSCL